MQQAHFVNVMRGEVSKMNESEIDKHSDYTKGKCVKTRTTLTSDRCTQLAKCI